MDRQDFTFIYSRNGGMVVNIDYIGSKSLGEGRGHKQINDLGVTER